MMIGGVNGVSAGTIWSFAAGDPPSPLFILGTYDSTFTTLVIEKSESASL